MVFLENGVCAPSHESEIAFCESELMCDLIYHQNKQIIDSYTLLCLESGDENVKEGVIAKISNAIKAMIEKIRTTIEGFLDGVRANSKNRLTADDYMNSETAKLALDADIVAMKDAIDAEFLEARTIVKMISNVTKMDPQDVAKRCDALNQKIIDNRQKYLHGAKGLVQLGIARKIEKDCIKNCSDIQEMVKVTESSVNALKNTASTAKGRKAADAYNVLNKFTATLYKLSDQSVDMSNMISKAQAKGSEKDEKRKRKAGK